MDEFIKRFAVLGVGDPESVVSYVFGILDSSGPDAQMVAEALEPYIEDKNERETVCTDICNWMKAKEASSASSSSNDQQNNIKDTIRARWTEQTENPTLTTAKPEHTIGLDKAEREATLRLARQIHDKRMEEEIAEEMANAAIQAEEGLASRNRAAVQQKVAQAQSARAAATQKHKAESKQAAKSDKKDKEERKEQRRMKAQKSERRGGF